jgi:hypothetical protein
VVEKFFVGFEAPEQTFFVLRSSSFTKLQLRMMMIQMMALMQWPTIEAVTHTTSSEGTL